VCYPAQHEQPNFVQKVEEATAFRLMKSSPTRISEREAPPPLQRLRERLQNAVSRFGGWAKRLTSQDQLPEPTSSLPTRPDAPGTRTLAARAGERSGSRERSERPTGTTAPIRRVTPARPSVTESMSRASERGQRSGSGSAGRGEAQPVPAAPPALQPNEAAPAGQDDTKGAATNVGALPAERTSEPAEEVHHALLLKGTRSGMLLTLEPGSLWQQVIEALAARLAESPSFFQQSVLSVDTRRRALQPAEMEALQALLARYAMTLKEVGSDELNDPHLLPSGAKRGTPAGNTAPVLAIRPGRDVTDALITRRTVRSGQQVRYESSVVIMGDVNSGAEVIAGGDVLVWGALRGTVHAGYPANEEAVVCALTLAPVQLRIGSHASRPPEDDSPAHTPEIASVSDGQIVVESWSAGRKLRR